MSDELRQREPREVDSAFKGWVAGLPCVACMATDGRITRPVHVAHVRFADHEAQWRSVGMQEKPHDRRCVPLCPPHHMGDKRRETTGQHQMSERAFWDALQVNIIRLVGDLSDAFDRAQSGEMVIARAAAVARRARG